MAHLPQEYYTQLRDKAAEHIGALDKLFELMEDHQIVGLLWMLKDECKSEVARHLLLSRQHGLGAIDEAETFYREHPASCG